MAFDMVGHGKSKGKRGLLNNFDNRVSDAERYIDLAAEYYRHVPIFLIGGSLGGLLTAHLAIKRPDLYRGLIFAVPAFKLKMKFQGLQYNLLKFMADCFPKLRFMATEAGLVRV